MSWEIMYDTLEQSRCACGKGIVRHSYMSMDDWNRSESGYYGEEIQCNDCHEKYHIEHNITHHPCRPWKSDCISDILYLIPNGMTLKHDVSQKDFNFSLEEHIVSSFEKDSLQMVIDDMIASKYSTRLKLGDSKCIVDLYYQRYLKRSLPNIITLLQECIYNYDSHEWTCEKMQKYRAQEQRLIEANYQIIKDIISHSYRLEFMVTTEEKDGNKRV